MCIVFFNAANAFRVCCSCMQRCNCCCCHADFLHELINLLLSSLEDADLMLCFLVVHGLYDGACSALI